ncbi:MAG: hypothetical protein FRX49_11174 [Trebouxia sp. A1-2]|nr:MAG: hypothetical protein FRX49_11174 [Trebouxia sp. A1-2]
MILSVHHLQYGVLQAKLGNPAALVSNYKYTYPAEHFDVPVNVDPSLQVSAEGATLNGSWRVIGSTGQIAIHVLPFANGLDLIMGRAYSYTNSSAEDTLVDVPYGNTSQPECGAMYNTSTNTFVPLHIAENPFCGAQALLPDGQGVVVGGDASQLFAPFFSNGLQAVRIIDPVAQTSTLVATMQNSRYYPTILTMPSGMLLIVGGYQQEAGGWGSMPAPSTTMQAPAECSPNVGGSFADPSYNNPTYQFFNATNNSLSPALALSILLESWPINSYPWLCVLPSGSVLIIAGSLMEVDYFMPDGAYADDAIGPLPTFPVPVSYPQAATMALLPLQPPLYEAQVLVAGGSSEYCANSMTPAGSTSWLLDLTPGANHSLVEEELAYPRVMGDLILLPDGRVFLCNGAQVGIQGGNGVAAAAANIGTSVAEIYDPSLPIGQRWSQAADSLIWRMYHSSAYLTPNAEVYVAGSETTAELRAQLFTPDYLHTSKPRPVITTAPSTLGYAANFTIGFSNVTTLDRVVLSRLAGSTHGIHFDQRQIVLDCIIQGATDNCASPPNSSIAPPGQYMLFVLNQGVPSVAEYITMQLPAVNSSAGSGVGVATAG